MWMWHYQLFKRQKKLKLSEFIHPTISIYNMALETIILI